MRLRLFTAAILLIMSAAACTKKPDCFTADTIKEITVESLNEKGLYIFLRSSGFNKKEHFFEMFKGLPTFDICGQTKHKLLFQVHVDTSIGQPEKLIVRDNQLEIVYADNDGAYQFDNISIVIE